MQKSSTDVVLLEPEEADGARTEAGAVEPGQRQAIDRTRKAGTRC